MSKTAKLMLSALFISAFFVSGNLTHADTMRPGVTIKSTSFKLGYDRNHKESNLTATFTGNITTGSDFFSMNENAFLVNLVNQQNIRYVVNSQQTN